MTVNDDQTVTALRAEVAAMSDATDDSWQ